MSYTDWSKIKAYYLFNSVSLREVAERFGVGQAAVYHRAERGKWREEKERLEREALDRVREKAVEKKADSLTEYLGELRDGIAEHGRTMLAKIGETMSYEEPFSPRDLKNLSGMFRDLSSQAKDLEELAGRGDRVQVIEWVNN